MQELNFRQIHLDFHAGKAVPDIGADFDPEEFAIAPVEFSGALH
jgi:hypothetical protein